jgi:hypothetical protein
MLAAWVANATLFGVGGGVASLQAISAALAAAAARIWGNTRMVMGPDRGGVSQGLPRHRFAQEKPHFQLLWQRFGVINALVRSTAVLISP